MEEKAVVAERAVLAMRSRCLRAVNAALGSPHSATRVLAIADVIEQIERIPVNEVIADAVLGPQSSGPAKE